MREPVAIRGNKVAGLSESGFSTGTELGEFGDIRDFKTE